MVTMQDTERHTLWSRLRVILAAVAIGLVAFVVSAALGSWRFGIILGIAVVIGGLTPPFSMWRRSRWQ